MATMQLTFHLLFIVAYTYTNFYEPNLDNIDRPYVVIEIAFELGKSQWTDIESFVFKVG